MKNINVLGDIHIGEATHKTLHNTIKKPRNAYTEKAWGAFLLELEKAGLQNIPGTVTIVNEGANEHEIEIVSHDSLTDPEDIKQYYKSCGCLLCLTWLLGAVDLHDENIIASGKQPVIVDFETLLQGTEERASEYFETSLAGSVTRTQLLPYFLKNIDVSGFSGKNGQNKPVYECKERPVQDYLEDLICGFRDTFSFVYNHKELFTELLHLFDPCSFRVILRPTSFYEKLILLLDGQDEVDKIANADGYLRIAYEKDIDVHRLSKAVKCLQNEVYAIAKGWIPLFYTYGNSCDIYADGRQSGYDGGEVCVMKQYFRTSPVGTAINRVKKLEKTELDKQLSIIRMVYHVYDLQSEKKIENMKAAYLKSLEKDWISHLPTSYIMLYPDGDRTIWTSIGWGLYDGITGVLCALAAVDSIKNPLFERLYRKLEIGVLQTKIQTKMTSDSCGLANGIAGIIAGLLHIYDISGEQKFKEDAEKLLDCFLLQISENTEMDVLSGLSGLCLQLPKVKGIKAIQLAERLLPVMKNANLDLTGAAHGKAGLALALGALQDTLGNNCLDERIFELMQEENAHYVKEKNNWIDLRVRNQISFMGGWCSGAPGIGMYRKKLMQYTRDKRIIALCEQDIQRTQQYILSRGELQRDTLCCGNAARLMASTYLGIENKTLCENLKRSCYSYAPKLYHKFDTADHNVSLMQGASGVAYVLAMAENEKCGEMLL